MLDLTNKQYNLLNFVHPSLMRLARYDREHGTELMDTLFIYLQNACNTQRSARMLSLHKNTLLYRLGSWDATSRPARTSSCCSSRTASCSTSTSSSLV